ncbi:MAG: imidazolonepropionase [Actinomycetota bacterium]|nr:imidazolonepropionase [Actinomycetota bacterium]
MSTTPGASLVVRNAAEVVTLAGQGPLRGDALRALAPDARLDIDMQDGLFAEAGNVSEGDAELDATGCTVVPGFVDCHTHLPFFGWRADEDAARLSGIRYETLHREEGGIFRSARLLSEASDDEVLEFSRGLAGEMLRRGTTTFETKSGYGLGVEAELRQLRVARRLAAEVTQTVVTTCLAAHAIPRDRSPGEWVGEVATELLPAVADQGLASAVDIYVESIAFSLEHAARLSEAAAGLGLAMRMHADQLEDGQAGSFAARWGFVSADHLNHTSLPAVGDLAASDTAAVLLPGATFTLRQSKRPQARALIEEGAIVALASDLNPGTSPVLAMPFVMALACRVYGLRPLEALAAATVNGAHVLGLGESVGRIAPGFRADAVVLDAPSFDHVCYRPDHDAVVAVICGGEVAHLAPGAESRLTPP